MRGRFLGPSLLEDGFSRFFMIYVCGYFCVYVFRKLGDDTAEVRIGFFGKWPVTFRPFRRREKMGISNKL